MEIIGIVVVVLFGLWVAFVGAFGIMAVANGLLGEKNIVPGVIALIVGFTIVIATLVINFDMAIK